MKKLLKTSKKMLAIVMAMMMLLSVAIPAAFAVDPCPDGEHEWKPRTIVEPNCTERGYTIYVCSKCGSVKQDDYVPAVGHRYDEADGVKSGPTCVKYGGITYTCEVCHAEIFEIDRHQPPTGHDLSTWDYVQYDDGFAKKRNCKNDGCDFEEYECDVVTGEKNKYYSVEFVNKYVIDTYFVAEDGTSLPETYTEKSLEKTYVLKGGDAVYSGSIPVRAKTQDYRKFKFVGWTTDSAVKSSVETVVDASKNVNANKVVYAEYAGVSRNELTLDDRYELSFSKENGAPTTKGQAVLHGDFAQYPFPEPTKEEDTFFTYEFEGWTRGRDLPIFDARTTPIYSSGVLYERFKAIPKDFTVEFYDYNDNKIGEAEKVHYGEPLTSVPDEFDKDAKDESYIYKFSGNWKLPNGVTANLDRFTFTYNDIKDGVIKLKADYNRQAVQYRFKLNVMDIDGETPAERGTVQILNSSGQFAAGTKLDDNGQVVLSLTYDSSYLLQITRYGNVKEVKIEFIGDTLYVKDVNTDLAIESFLLFDKDGNALIPTVNITLELDNIVPGGDVGEHNCICHTIFARPWITLFNIIYNLFGRKMVCCVDMYERHGDILAYTK